MPSHDVQAAIEQAAAAIASARALLIGAGAGMGVDSGLPDFRGNQGFWRAYPPFRHLGLSFVDLANPRWFASDPALAWGFYGHRQGLYRRTTPHAGFDILRRWSEAMPGGVFVFTSNVDGQFQRAGFAASRIYECHGSLEHLQCTVPCTSDIWSAETYALDVDETTFRAHPPWPSCSRCGAPARPNILMFGDAQWLESRSRTQASAYSAWREQVEGEDLVIVECGAGTAIPSVRYECEYTTGTLIRINPREPRIRGDRGISLAMGALEALSLIDDALSQASSA